MEVELLKPHTHAGKDYPVGAKINLDKDLADWLIKLGVAKATTITKQLKGD